MHRIDYVIDSQFVLHGENAFLYQVRGMGGHDMDTDDSLGLAVSHDLYQSACVSDYARFRDEVERQDAAGASNPSAIRLGLR
jgi:hypothetical protein